MDLPKVPCPLSFVSPGQAKDKAKDAGSEKSTEKSTDKGNGKAPEQEEEKSLPEEETPAEETSITDETASTYTQPGNGKGKAAS